MKQEILVAGLGVTGVATAKALAKLGKNVLVYEENSSAEMQIKADEIKLIANIDVTFKIPETLPKLIITSPGWKPNHPVLILALSSGCEVISEVEYAWRIDQESAKPKTWIGLTGTNGKTTTVGMAEAIFKADDKKAVACGNIGKTVIEVITGEEEADFLILELSSFQLHWSEQLRLHSAAILNIADDHLDWHGSFHEYLAAKKRITDGANLVIINRDDRHLNSLEFDGDQKLVKFTLDAPRSGEIGVVEELLVDRAFVDDPQEASALAELSDINPQAPHNVANALAAMALARSCGVKVDSIAEGLRNFAPGHHRIEEVENSGGIRWINDSKATNPHAANASLAAFSSIIWIAGGLAKGADMDDLIQSKAGRLKAVLLIGTDRNLISDALSKHAPDIPKYFIDGDTADELMGNLISKGKELAVSGDVVLLAPACASMDQFTSYAHRGDLFAEKVKQILGNQK
jgi:UDP-N-acetylmuramoylalanine--D-glutamate ligase